MKLTKKLMAAVSAPLRWDWTNILKKVAKAFSPGLAKLGEILVVSGAAALGLKGADGDLALLSVDFSKIDAWWAVAVVGAGLFIWALADYFGDEESKKK